MTTTPHMTGGEQQGCENTDRHLWREREYDYYADSIHVTKQGGIGINVGGTVFVHTLRQWHDTAAELKTVREILDDVQGRLIRVLDERDQTAARLREVGVELEAERELRRMAEARATAAEQEMDACRVIATREIALRLETEAQRDGLLEACRAVSGRCTPEMQLVIEAAIALCGSERG